MMLCIGFVAKLNMENNEIKKRVMFPSKNIYSLSCTWYMVKWIIITGCY